MRQIQNRQNEELWSNLFTAKDYKLPQQVFEQTTNNHPSSIYNVNPHTNPQNNDIPKLNSFKMNKDKPALNIVHTRANCPTQFNLMQSLSGPEVKPPITEPNPTRIKNIPAFRLSLLLSSEMGNKYVDEAEIKPSIKPSKISIVIIIFIFRTQLNVFFKQDKIFIMIDEYSFFTSSSENCELIELYSTRTVFIDLLVGISLIRKIQQSKLSPPIIAKIIKQMRQLKKPMQNVVINAPRILLANTIPLSTPKQCPFLEFPILNFVEREVIYPPQLTQTMPAPNPPSIAPMLEAIIPMAPLSQIISIRQLMVQQVEAIINCFLNDHLIDAAKVLVIKNVAQLAKSITGPNYLQYPGSFSQMQVTMQEKEEQVVVKMRKNMANIIVSTSIFLLF